MVIFGVIGFIEQIEVYFYEVKGVNIQKGKVEIQMICILLNCKKNIWKMYFYYGIDILYY